jgi:hypothetical protein
VCRWTAEGLIRILSRDKGKPLIEIEIHSSGLKQLVIDSVENDHLYPETLSRATHNGTSITHKF